MSTIKDVAKACGVSTATVSYVLNGKRQFPSETRERVLQTARTLSYHPNAMARGLSHKRLYTIGVLFGVIDSVAVVTNPYASYILQGVITVASESNCNVAICTRPWRSASISAAAYRDRRADGIVVVAPRTDSDMIPGLSALHIPLVAISYPVNEYQVPTVDTDNAEIIRAAFAHLRGLGHTRIALLNGPSNMHSGVARRRALETLIKADGLPLTPEYVTTPGSYDSRPAYDDTRRLLALPKPPTAIIASNDGRALAAMDAARDLGISVPIRLSIIGIDDAPESAVVRPALTTVRQPLTEVGATATRLLADIIAGNPVDAGFERTLCPTLIIRDSTAPPVD